VAAADAIRPETVANRNPRALIPSNIAPSRRRAVSRSSRPTSWARMIDPGRTEFTMSLTWPAGSAR
jgi:hypothetical protein